MSYILEALRKADAERERGAVPDLHAQPLPLAVADDDAASRLTKPWLWPGVGGAVVLLAVLAWQFTAHDAPPVVTGVPVPASDSGPAASSISPPAPSRAPEPAPVPAPAAVAPLERPAIAAPRERIEPQPPGAAPAAARAAKKAVPPQPAARVPLLNELPDDVRRQVPAMAIGGSVYSAQPASRMLIVNGQVFREGNPVASDLKLEQIGPKSAVFSIRGQRFEMSL